jgi:hypothetical protein
MSSEKIVKVKENELLKIQVAMQEIDKLNLQLRNYVLELYLLYKLDPNEYKFDPAQGGFVKVAQDGAVETKTEEEKK